MANQIVAAEQYIQSEKYETIRKDLLDQLERNGTVGEHYVDLVEDYMSLWITKAMAADDIKERGVNVEWQNGANQSGVRKNDSVDVLIKTNAQMLKLLPELGIKPSTGGGENYADLEM